MTRHSARDLALVAVAATTPDGFIVMVAYTITWQGCDSLLYARSREPMARMERNASKQRGTTPMRATPCEGVR